MSEQTNSPEGEKNSKHSTKRSPGESQDKNPYRVIPKSIPQSRRVPVTKSKLSDREPSMKNVSKDNPGSGGNDIRTTDQATKKSAKELPAIEPILKPTGHTKPSPDAPKDKRPRVLMAPGMNRCIACYSCMMACARMVYRSFSMHKSAIKIRTRGGYSSKFVANICRACIDPPCAKACCVQALVPREGGGLRFFRDRCIGCRKCASACVVQVVDFDEIEKKAIVCIQCGNCAKFCPHECLTMEISPHAENPPGGAFPPEFRPQPHPRENNPTPLD